MVAPDSPKIYHILHADRLPSVVADGHLWSDAVMAGKPGIGTSIGMNEIKARRLHELELRTHPGLHVGECVPFYFCPRSVMLYLISQANHPNLGYRGGQGPIVHLQSDLRGAVVWAEANNLRWAFTLSNAGAYYFEDRADFAQLDELDWTAIGANKWSGAGVPSGMKDGKQAEFLLEDRFPWELVEAVGVKSTAVAQQVASALAIGGHRPPLQIRSDWYY